MPEPFSITVGAIGLAVTTKNAIGGSIKRLKALQHAPAELQDLLAELSQFAEVLRAIEEPTNPSENDGSPLENLLRTAKDKMVEFDSLVEYQLTQAGTSDKVDRLRWIGSSKEIETLRRQLGDIRSNLNVLIGVRSSTTLRQTLDLMRQLHLDNQRLHQMASALAYLPQMFEEVQSTGSAVNRFLSKFPHYTLQTSGSESQSMPDNAQNFIAPVARNNAYAKSRNQLQLLRTYQVAYCHPNCPCECHGESFSWSTWSLARYFGRAVFERKVSSRIDACRHISSCKASAVAQIQVIYFIPTWFAMKAIYIRYTSSPWHDPEWVIRVPRLIDGSTNRGFQAIYYTEDISRFKSAIADGECTPYDIDQYGEPLLRLIITFERSDMIRHLVDMGVDILRPVVVGVDWLDNLWGFITGRNILASRRLQSWMNEGSLRDLIPQFPWDEYVEAKKFTLLHEIVCGISGLDLDIAVQAHSADINRLDSKGRSPLTYAIALQNLTAVRTLLRQGANTNGSDRKDLMMEWINTAYLCNAALSELLPVDKLLIERGIDMDTQICGPTMLMELCAYGFEETSVARIELLVSYGANLELRDFDGFTALHLAMAYKKYKNMKVLLDSGAQLDAKTKNGDTIFHLAVILSMSDDFVKELPEMDVARLDLDQRNKEGYTAYDLLRKRNGLRWEIYRERWFETSGKYGIKFRFGQARHQEDDYLIILALEALLHQIQDSQGVPKDQQYPPLGPYLSDDKDEEPVPGAWPL